MTEWASSVAPVSVWCAALPVARAAPYGRSRHIAIAGKRKITAVCWSCAASSALLTASCIWQHERDGPLSLVVFCRCFSRSALAPRLNTVWVQISIGRVGWIPPRKRHRPPGKQRAFQMTSTPFGHAILTGSTGSIGQSLIENGQS